MPMVAMETVHAPTVVDGLDLQTALTRLGGNRELYVRAANDFVAILDQVSVDFQGLLDQREAQEVYRLLHTLKGNAGTLGAIALAKEAARLEQLCKADGSLAACTIEAGSLGPLVRLTKGLLLQAVAQLAPQALPEVEKNTNAQDAEAAVLVLKQLMPLLEASDMEALERFAECRSLLQNLPNALCDQLEDALQNLDFERAYTLCTPHNVGALEAKFLSMGDEVNE